MAEKKSERHRLDGLTIRVLDGRYIMGDLICGLRLIGGRVSWRISVVNRWGDDFIPDWVVGPRQRTSQLWRDYHIDRGSGRPKKSWYVVFPDFRIREEKLAPILDALIREDIYEVQYSALRRALGM
ncbi:hypothetical protein HMPREF2562_09600 [Corynebacterium sp. HMSC077G07]|nr:hypothetical protein EGX79_03085 [Corynebacterium jeikeium]OFN38182.1 hypothetical protein HMPREF2562_09600 [Corynebacterium sp. HMSC077G07]